MSKLCKKQDVGAKSIAIKGAGTVLCTFELPSTAVPITAAAADSVTVGE